MRKHKKEKEKRTRDLKPGLGGLYDISPTFAAWFNLFRLMREPLPEKKKKNYLQRKEGKFKQ